MSTHPSAPTSPEASTAPATESPYQSIGQHEFHGRYGEILEAVRQGTRFRIKRWGKPVAWLVPIDEFAAGQAIGGRSAEETAKLNLVTELSLDELKILIEIRDMIIRGARQRYYKRGK